MTDPTQRYNRDQLGLALHRLVECVQQRSMLFADAAGMADGLEPDLK